jgi:hypothetical protein
MDEKGIIEFQNNLVKADSQLRRKQARLTFLVGAVAGIFICFTSKSQGLPVFTWITIPVGMGLIALILRAALKN